MNRRDILLGSATAIATTGMVDGAAADRGPVSYDAQVARTWAPIDAGGGILELVRAATLAANSHNAQPWRFTASGRHLAIAPDPTRRLPAVDPDDHHLLASLGCAVENAIQAAPALGYTASLEPFAIDTRPLVLALEPAAPRHAPLLGAIVERQTVRAAYDGKPVPAADMAALAAAGTMPGVDCLLLTDHQHINAVIDLVVEGNSRQMRDAAFMTELMAWIRFSKTSAAETGDGLYAASSGNPTLPDWLGRRLLPLVFTEKAESAKYASHIRSSSGVAVFTSARDDAAHWIAAARACQRFALQATALGLKLAFINQPVEVPHLRRQLATYLNLGDRRVDLIVRFGRGPGLPRSLRRPVASVVSAMA